MADYLSSDGRVRILSIAQRAEWRRGVNRRGGRYTTWSAWDTREKRWIAQETPTLGAVKRRLIEAGYSESLHRFRREAH
jgi:hypothetical protein